MKRDMRFHSSFAVTRRDFLAGVTWLGAAAAVRGWAAPLSAEGIDHVNIRVPDVRRSADFYIRLFGGAHVARSPNAKAQTANPDSPSGVLWFVRLGESFLAISPTAPGLSTGIDHYCLAIRGIRRQRDEGRRNRLEPPVARRASGQSVGPRPGRPRNPVAWKLGPVPGSRIGGRVGSGRAARRCPETAGVSGDPRWPTHVGRCCARPIRKLLPEAIGRRR